MTELLQPLRPPKDLRYRCSQCGELDSDGCEGPGSFQKTGTGYRRVPGRWLCDKHARKAWRDHFGRLRLIRASTIVGFPMTTTQYRAWREEEDEQPSLLGEP